jgi:hydroxymethylpyrimidine/phosphomethylpyrimidine kinase
VIPRILTIAGSDSGGGAGIQADLKTILALGGYGMSAITAITAQNTCGVSAIQMLPPDLIYAQITDVLSDLGADAIKIGMVGSADSVNTIAAAIAGFTGPVIVDPVMVATSGAQLGSDAATKRIVSDLIPRAFLVTPNLPEAEILSGRAIGDRDAMAQAAREILALGPKAVLLKGGHLPGPMVADLLLDQEGMHWFESAKIESRHTHGTGCTLASAIATQLGHGCGLLLAVAKARDYVRHAIETAPGFGQGHGPLNHGYAIKP